MLDGYVGKMTVRCIAGEISCHLEEGAIFQALRWKDCWGTIFVDLRGCARPVAFSAFSFALFVFSVPNR